MLFSATLDHQIMGLISQTQDPLRFEVEDKQPTVEGVEHHLFEVHRMDKTDVLVVAAQRPARTDARLHADEARVRPARRTGSSSEGINAEPIHGDLVTGRARTRAQAVRGRDDRRARRDRRRRARTRHRQHHARRELRPAGGPQGVPPSRRTNGSCRTIGHGGHARDVAGAVGRREDGADAASCTRTSSRSSRPTRGCSRSEPTEFEGNPPAAEQPDKPATAGAYARLARRRGGGGRRRR